MLLKPPSDPFVEEVKDERGNYLALRSSAFDGIATSKEVHQAAKELFRTLNVAMSENADTYPVTNGAVVEFVPDGQPRRHHYLEVEAARIGLRVSSPSIAIGARSATLSVSSVIIPEKRTGEGLLIKSTSLVWDEIVRALGDDWSIAYRLPPEKWEEIVAGAFKREGYDEVTLTPRSGDHGRDLIAVKHGIGCVKIIGSVKRYAVGTLVPYDHVRALIGVLSGEQDASKGIIATTSDFPPKVAEDPFISRFLPTRLELLNCAALQRWLADLSKKSTD